LNHANILMRNFCYVKLCDVPFQVLQFALRQKRSYIVEIHCLEVFFCLIHDFNQMAYILTKSKNLLHTFQITLRTLVKPFNKGYSSITICPYGSPIDQEGLAWDGNGMRRGTGASRQDRIPCSQGHGHGLQGSFFKGAVCNKRWR